MSWNLEGLRVWGMYLDQFPINGKVVLSRVKYGGGVQHTVVLEDPITVFSAVRQRILLDHENVTRVASSNMDEEDIKYYFETNNITVVELAALFNLSIDTAKRIVGEYN